MQVRQGRLNFTTMADILEGAPVMTGIFSVLNYPAIILFDSGPTKEPDLDQLEVAIVAIKAALGEKVDNAREIS